MRMYPQKSSFSDSSLLHGAGWHQLSLVSSPTSRVLGWHACRGWHFTSLPPPLSAEAAMTDVNSRDTGEGLQLLGLHI